MLILSKQDGKGYKDGWNWTDTVFDFGYHASFCDWEVLCSMGWRFRKSFQVIPGLRLNLSKSGLSASIGGSPLTLNIGQHGLMRTASIPGTGISFRQHFSGPEPSPKPSNAPLGTSPILRPPLPDAPPLHFGTPVTQEIRSAPTELLTSESLKQLKDLIATAYTEREDIKGQLSSAQSEKARASSRYFSWEQGFLLRRLFKNKFAHRRALLDTETQKVHELEEQLRLTVIAAEIEIDQGQAEPFFRMRDDFAALCECAAIWDVKSQRATDRFHERTIADQAVERQKVNFHLNMCDLIQWDSKIPHLVNANGGDIYLYPGFILYRATRSAFSVIDYHDLREDVSSVRFNETEGVPSDSQIIGQTWFKANKDGSRDRRFANNYPVPIAGYARWVLKTPTGLWEEYQFSNPDRLLRFVASLRAFIASFHSIPAGRTN